MDVFIEATAETTKRQEEKENEKRKDVSLAGASMKSNGVQHQQIHERRHIRHHVEHFKGEFVSVVQEPVGRREEKRGSARAHRNCVQ